MGAAVFVLHSDGTRTQGDLRMANVELLLDPSHVYTSLDIVSSSPVFIPVCFIFPRHSLECSFNNWVVLPSNRTIKSYVISALTLVKHKLTLLLGKKGKDGCCCVGVEVSKGTH